MSSMAKVNYLMSAYPYGGVLTSDCFISSSIRLIGEITQLIQIIVSCYVNISKKYNHV